MTEDDTFKALIRLPYNQLLVLMREEDFSGSIFDKFNEVETTFLKKYGWTVIDFRLAWIKNVENDPQGAPVEDRNWVDSMREKILEANKHERG